MANVQVTGVFMGANLKSNDYEGKKTTKLRIDLYQPESESTEKAITVTSDDIELIQKLNKDYAVGSVFKCEATVTAYKNKAYFKLHKLIG